ncbi:MAG: Asp-tRNA(Asn)/Glu-tRNA(Gln) amidotransferase subunit GatB [Alphaproteobacteria bacterium]|jgi:aspartyl-tRNA(Asn)/glutamyl-tRNA(Gln) amidotransferase subunit B|nr:Asp-tRNA(Asn)/Glu-tRNA(Gln) amidotransferase subunit GatB [Alphaproteobacteria bacterium]
MTYTIKGQTGDWEVVMGLEIHCQVISNSKLFSPASTKFGAEPNSQVHLVDAAQPGMLPVINEKCIEQAVKTGLGINAVINNKSVFARKNYFYADLPQGYQISQADQPIVGEGHVDIVDDQDEHKRIRVERIHLEQDAGKSIHDMEPGKSMVDLNRTGIALMEIVSYPDIRSPKEAGEYVKKIRSIVRYLETCDGNMDEGSMRCDVNVSVRKVGEEGFRTRTETKNVNSVKFVMQASEYEAKRQIEAYENGEEIVQETRLFNTSTGETRSMRGKENANDYRYFPDPDLLPLVLSDEYIQDIKNNLPELPSEKKERFVKDLGLSDYDAEVLTAEKENAVYFETAIAAAKKAEAKSISNLITSELFGILKKEEAGITESPISAEQIADLADLIKEGVISGKIAKQIFELMIGECKSKMPSVIVEEKGLKQMNDTGAIESLIDEVIAANPDKVAEIKAGKDKLKGWFVGQVMQKSQGKANPGQVNQLLAAKLK